MICAVMQPTYLPWCGYFDLIDSVDKFVFLDDVKLEKSDWHVRNKIKSANGDIMLTISVKLPNGRMETMINQAELNFDKPWQKKHLKSIYINYKKSPFFDSIYEFLEPLILSNKSILSAYTISIIKEISSLIGINTEFILASEMYDIPGKKETRLINICNKLNVNQYISPAGAVAYLEKNSSSELFANQGIKLYYHQYKHPIYDQLYGDFLSYLSIIDMLFNCGTEQTLKLIRNGHNIKGITENGK